MSKDANKPVPPLVRSVLYLALVSSLYFLLKNFFSFSA